MSRHVLIVVGVVAAVWGCTSGSSISVISDVSHRYEGLQEGGGESPCGDSCPASLDVAETDARQDVAAGEEVGCGDCREPTPCEPGEAKCEGNSVSSCLADGSGWDVAVPCPAQTTCAGGDCGDWPEGQCELALVCMESKQCDEPTAACVQSCIGAVPVGIGVFLNEIFWCVVQSCNSWQPESACFAEARVGECKTLFETCTGECVLLCDDKECGPDSCGGLCGECAQGYACDPMGHCLCQPDCEGKECGPNGCGAQCGLCIGRKPVCNEESGLCEVEPQGPCGNSVCEPELGETCFNCGYDCGDCPSCGDGECEEAEQCDFCPEDCGPCTFGDCCAFHDFAGCEDAAVVECVCALEPDCCLGPWHNDCVLVADDCGADCN